MKEDYIQIGKNLIEIILIIVILFASIKLACFYMPFLVAYIISCILDPIIKVINKRFKMTRKTITIIVLILILMTIFALFIWGMINLFAEANNLLNGLNNYIDKALSLFKEITSKINLNKVNLERFNIIESTFTDFIKMITDYIKDTLVNLIDTFKKLPNMLINTIITILAVYFFITDKFYILDSLEFQFSKRLIGKFIVLIKKITKSLGDYIKAEIILSIVTFIIVLISLNIFYMFGMKIEYPIMFALLIGFIDLLPIFGAGFILIPWSMVLFINREITFGLWVFALYLTTLIVKQVLEPKLISSGLGIHPVFTLISMYTGFRFFGVTGLIAGPIILIILKHIFSDILDKGFINSLND